MNSNGGTETNLYLDPAKSDQTYILTYFPLTLDNQQPFNNLNNLVQLTSTIENEKNVSDSECLPQQIDQTTIVLTTEPSEGSNSSWNNEIYNQSSLNCRNGISSDKWIHPIYCIDTHQLINPKEIKEKIKSHYTIDTGQKSPFICKVEHECRKSYTAKYSIEFHLFSHFFYVPCPNCGKYYKAYKSMSTHLNNCKKTIFVAESIMRYNEQFLNMHNQASQADNRLQTMREISESEHSEISISSDKTDDELVHKQSDGNSSLARSYMKTKDKTREKYHNGRRIYRCPFCDYVCLPGRRRHVMVHLNSHKSKGQLIPPACSKRRELKPADPVTGLYEQLEPLAVRPERF